MNTPDLFDYAAGLALKERGQDTAARNRAEVLEIARNFAVQHAITHGTVTADDVRARCERAGIPWSEVGNAAGSIFKGNRWEFVRFAQSEAVERHAGMIRVWKLNAKHIDRHE